MSRVKRVKISVKKPITNLLRHYGIGGVENYEPEQVDALLRALALLLDCCGLVEVEQVGKFLIRLSDNPEALNNAMEELEKMGYY
jgi:hypothetical protein